MNRSRLSLIDILQPRSYAATPERSKVTRTIVQPEIDAFEEMETLAAAKQPAPGNPRKAQQFDRFAAA